MSERIAIVDGYRTPFVKAGTALKDVPAYELGRAAVSELLARTEIDPNLIDEVIIGNVAQPPESANISRVIALMAGVPPDKTAYTVHRNCASGVEAVTSALEKILSGYADIVVAGGTESMSLIPLFFGREITNLFADLARAKTFFQRLGVMARFRPRHYKPHIGLVTGLTDYVSGMIMGDTAEILAKEFGISREEQDQFALESHRRAARAIKEGKLKEEIVPVLVPPKYETVVAEDFGYREGQTIEALAKLKPYFDRSENGTVTVGNSSQVTDGAAAALVMKESRAREMGYEPLGYIRSYAYAGLEPERMGLGPAYATPRALEKAGLSLADIQLIEINEAFAAQVLACNRLLRTTIGEFNLEITNVNGGAIALGHPVGSTGTRLIVTILREMRRRNLSLGLVTLCIGGGQGAAIILER